jgi:hypothetical protein
LKTNTLAIFSSLIIFISCDSSQQKATQSSLADSVSYKSQVFEKRSPNCVKEDSDCATVRFSTPEFQEQSLNKQIQSDLITLFVDEADPKRPTDFAGLSTSFLDSYQTTIQNAGTIQKNQVPIAWKMEATTKVIRQTEPFVMTHTNTDLTMSQQPISLEFYHVYTKKGARVTLEQIFKKGFDQKLLLIAETIFRKNENLKPADKLDEAHGYNFTDGKFLLNDNFTLTESGIKFLFNVQEIKPFDQGVTELEIPYSELKGILNFEL